MRLGHANIVTAFDGATIGTKVVDVEAFNAIVETAIDGHDWSPKEGSTEGQEFITLPAEAAQTVTAGIGKKTNVCGDYVIRSHRGRVSTYLKREHAAAVEGVAVVVYTLDAYLADPDVAGDAAEVSRVVDAGVTHVIVAVLAFAGPRAPWTPYRLIANLAGGNKDALLWDADKIRAEAKAAIDYNNEWSVVAD